MMAIASSPEINFEDLSLSPNIFLQDEIVETILTCMDNQALLKARPISRTFNHEVGKILSRRGYLHTKHFLNVSSSEDVGQLLDLMENGLLHQSILLGDLCVKIKESIHPTFQTFMSNYGFRISDLNLSCHFLTERKGNISTKILMMCPNVKAMTLHFYDSEPCDDTVDISFLNESYTCPIELKHLTDFSFEPIIRYNVNSYYAGAIEFYLKMFKEIILSAENLKNVCVKTVQITDYLRSLTDDSEVAYRLRQVKTQFEPCID